MKTYPKLKKPRPSAIFTGCPGSRPRWPSHDQSPAKRGARRKMSPALTDWNHVVGTSKPPSIRFVRRSVNRFRLEPACSNASQKTALKRMKTKIVAVAPRVAGRVELPHHHRHAGLEVSGADHDERQPEDEHGHAGVRPCERSDARHGEHEVAERDQEATDDHRAVRAQQPVGDPPADDREQVREAGVPSIEEARVAA